MLKLLEKETSFFLSVFLSLEMRWVVMEETGHSLCVWEEHRAHTDWGSNGSYEKKINSQGNWDLYPVLSGNLVSWLIDIVNIVTEWNDFKLI